MFDFDLSELYDVETRTLKQAVRRNIHRFPNDFLIVLLKEEQEVAMLASVLKSEKAILVNIDIMRAFLLHCLGKFLNFGAKRTLYVN